MHGPVLQAIIMSAHAPNHVTLQQGAKNNYTFGSFEHNLHIHYTTFMGLRWPLRAIYR